MSTHCLNLSNWADIFGQWLYDWQTLIGAGLALFAAYIAGKGLNKQIMQAEKFRSEDLAQRHAAARCVLPIALASIGELIDTASERVSTAIEEIDDPEFDAAFDYFEAGRHEILEFPNISISNELTSSVRQFVETLKDEENIRHVAELMSSLQILSARYNGFRFGQSAPIEALYGLLLDAAKVRMLTNAMFNYGRFVDENQFGIVDQLSIDEAWDLMLKEAVGLVFMRSRFDRFADKLGKRIESYKGRQVSPWNEKFAYLQ